MNTWTCKRVLTGLALLALAGCSELPAGAGAGKTQSAGRQTSALLAGRVALTAPAGFCIDPSSVTTSGRTGFAMLARCAQLSPQTALVALSGQSPAVMTVTTKPWTEGDTEITDATIAAAYPDGAVIERRPGGPVPMVKARGDRAFSALDDTHWRGAFVVNDQLVVIGLFAPKDSRALGASGANLVSALGRRTETASRQVTTGTAAPIAGGSSSD
ncbi:MAG: hypothetical protein CML68_19985 [Rhodobacteraceae bacterium]|nr:hypothetical protein [Paracoccaceae bacterium]